MFNFSKKAEMNILLLGTMSSGKTALLNALLGGDYFPSANQATTNKVFLINSSNKRKNFEYKDEKTNEYYTLCGSVSRELNSDINSNLINISVFFDFVSDINHSINIFDVPGYNYSGNMDHAKILDNVIKCHSFTDVFVIIDYTQLFINDQDMMFHVYIKKIIKNNPNAKLLFILNKVDKEDISDGDDVAKSIQKLADLISKNFKDTDYSIFPISALIASICKKEISGKNKKNHSIYKNCRCYKVTDHERSEVSSIINLYDLGHSRKDTEKLCIISKNIINEYSDNKEVPPSFAVRVADNIYSLFDKGHRKKIKKVLEGSGIGFVERYLKSRCIQIRNQHR